MTQPVRQAVSSFSGPAKGRTLSSRRSAKEARFGTLLTIPYALLLLVFGVLPAVYALYLSFVKPTGGLTLYGNFVYVARDFRFVASLLHVAYFSLLFVIPAVIVAICLGLLMDGRRRQTATAFQVIYYIPQGLIGAAGVVLWLFMLTPSVSPAGIVLRAMGFENAVQVVGGWHFPFALAIIAVWTSGTSILLMHAAFKAIPGEIVEAAYVDGANAARVALFIKIPMIRKWVAYTLILHMTASLQIFVEPQLLNSIANVGLNWSPLQLAYAFAYQYVNFPASATLSFEILAIGVIAALIIIKKTDLFRTEI